MIEYKSIDRVLHYFREISKIPRCSGNEEEISNYLKNFGKERGFPVYQDKLYNVIIRKPATKGYEDSPTVTLQGHMDMVCIKTEDSDHDFTKDGLNIVEKNGFICAKDTTLGADNGVALAIALAILESDDIPHPEIEVLFTSEEESTMNGVIGLSQWVLKGNRLINLDSDIEGILTAGSAGGITIVANYKKKYEKCFWEAFDIKFSGLKGGHSGMEIDKNRGNIIKVMAHFFDELYKKVNFRIGKIHAGTKDNAIPDSGEVVLSVEYGSKDVLKLVKDETLDYFKDCDGNLSIEINETKIDETWNKSTSCDIVNALIELPTGINTFIGESKTVESSSNLALIKESEDEIFIEISLRSSKEEELKKLLKTNSDILKKRNLSFKTQDDYPEWQFLENSKLREISKKVYKDMYGKEMETLVVHAGLECGTIKKKYPEMDIISIGPNLYDIHTPNEKMEIESLNRFYEYMLELLKEMK